MTEAYTSLPNALRFYTDGVSDGPHIPFNFELISNMNVNSTAADFKASIDSWNNQKPAGYPSNWVVCFD